MTLGLLACGGGGGGGGGSTSDNSTAVNPDRALAPVTASRVDVDSTTPYVGIGINGMSYYGATYMMADLMYESQFRDMNWQETVSKDANGIPTTDFLLIISGGQTQRVKPGIYKLSFRGQAAVGVDGTPEDSTAQRPYMANQSYDSATNMTTVDLVVPATLRSECWLVFQNTRRTAASTTADGVSEMHLWRPGYPTDGSALFSNEFIAAMKKFHLIRGMDFVSANSNGEQNWSDRSPAKWLGTPATNKGHPWELLVQLANATGNDLWLNIPVKASDDYLTQLAQLLRYGSDGVNPYTSTQANPVYPPLKAGIKVYLEYGNELWNSGPGFWGFYWTMPMAQAVMADTTHPIDHDNAINGDQYRAQRRWIAYRSASISLKFREVFGDAAMMNTVRPILASQVGNGQLYLSEGLQWAEDFYGKVRTSPANPVARKVSELWWGGGGAAYYDSSSDPNFDVATTSAAQREQVMSAYFAGLPSAQFATSTAIDALWTRGYGLHSVAYEGGPGPGGSALGTAANPAISPYYNADPRMKLRMIEAHKIYQANGGEMLSYYVYSGSPPWDFVNDLVPGLVSDTDTVKLGAIETLRTQTKADITLGRMVPGSITLLDSKNAAIGMITYSGDYQQNNLAKFAPGTPSASFAAATMVPVRAPAAGTYTFSVTAAETTPATLLELLVNGNSAGVWVLPGRAGLTPAASTTLTAPLKAGLNVIRLRSLSGTTWVRDLVIQ